MVKEKHKEVCLDPKEPCARTYAHGDEFEQVTVPDMGMSLSQMVQTNTVGMSSGKYTDPGFNDDEVGHNHPDYEKLGNLDMVDKENFVKDWEQKPENYEKKDVSTTVETKEEDDGETVIEPEVKKASSGAGA